MGNSYRKLSTAEALLTQREEESCGFFQTIVESFVNIAFLSNMRYPTCIGHRA
jgi:hypothetical protein